MIFLESAIQQMFYLLVVLGALVFIHELGHFLVAKAFGVRVEVFSLGFGKRLFGFRRGATDYRVALIPLGGYVKMAGEMFAEPEGIEADHFTAKPRWQRLLIVLAVLVVGAVVAILIAWFAILFTGRYPRALFDYVVGVGRWALRVQAYATLLITDRYPPFSLQ